MTRYRGRCERVDRCREPSRGIWAGRAYSVLVISGPMAQYQDTGTINGQIKLNPSTVSAVSVVEAAIEAIAPAAESKGVQVTNHVEGMVADV